MKTMRTLMATAVAAAALALAGCNAHTNDDVAKADNTNTIEDIESAKNVTQHNENRQGHHLGKTISSKREDVYYRAI